ncbi:translocation/assembly module TamB domain-containing protein [Bernardetia sp.]|uniref:translocation/assembly module TamB domain-containing protein n=1 Tax=Bernardetia sp. TaxID=1937974 RepID=UPI0025BFD9A6|nr:translocation/assembly module TamB domain-containing protein [Bernardetia sp.]
MNFLQNIKNKFSNKKTANQSDKSSKPQSKTKRVFKKITKILMWIVGSVLGLVLLIFVLLFLPPVQNFLTNKAEDFLSKKLTTKVEINKIRLSLPLGVTINGLYIEDLQKDTLLYAGHFNADLNPFALLKKTVQITEIELEDVYANIWIDKDSVSNIDFLDKAFAPTDSAKMSEDQTTTQLEANDTTSGAGFIISLGGIDFKNINAKFDDRYSGNDIVGKIGQIKVDVDDFDLNNLSFTVKDVLLKDTDLRYIQTHLPPPTPEKPDTTSSEIGFQIDMNEINLENITAFYQSNVTGQQVDGKVGSLLIKAKQTNLGTQKIVIQDVELNKTYLSYKQGIVATALDSAIEKSAENVAKEAQEVAGTKEDEGKPWVIEVKNVVLADNEIIFTNENAEKLDYGFDANHIHFKDIALEAENFKFYPDNIAADLKTIQATDHDNQFALKDFDGNIHLDSNGISVTDLKIQTTRSKIGQKVKLDASLENLAQDWQNADLEINLDGTEIALADVFYFVPDLAKQVNLPRETTEKIKISGQATGKANNATLKDFQIKGLINTHLLVNGNIKGLPEIENIYADIKINKLTSSRQDLNKLVPRGTLPAGFNFPQRISMNASAKGSMEDMFVELLANLDNTKINLGGTVKNPTDPEKMYLNISTKEFLVYLNDVKNWIPDTLLPSNLTLPPKIDGNIVFTGYLNDFKTDTKLKTTLGNVGAEGTLKNLIAENAIPSYNITATVENAQLGTILQDTTLGIADLKISANGSGFEPEIMKATIDGNVNKFEFQDYVYKDLKIDGKVDGLAYNGKLNMQDKNLTFDFVGNVVWDTLKPKFVVDLDLKKADLQALNFYEEPLTVSLNLDADITGMSLDNVRGNANLRRVIIGTKKRTFRIDTAAFVSVSQKGETNINLQSDLISAHIEGNLDVSTFVATVKNHVNTYIEIDPVQPNKEIGTQQMDFDIKIHKSELLTALVPSLTKFEPASLDGKYRSDTKKFELNGNFPKIVYGGIVLDSLKINVDSDKEALNYRIGVAEVVSGTYQFEHPLISGQAANNKADLNIKLTDTEGKEQFRIATRLERPDTTKFIVSLAPTQILNYEDWTARKGNQIILPSDDSVNLSIKEFMLTHDNQTISARTTDNDKNLAARFTNFELSTITEMAAPNDTTQLAAGRLNGKVDLQNFQTEMQFLADLKIEDLTVLNSKLGDLKIDAENSTAKDRYDVNVNLTGENRFELTGYYNAREDAGDALNMNLDIQRLYLPSLENLTMGNLEDTKGTITGNFTVKGTTQNPKILGNLDFNQASFFLTASGTYLQLENETIKFDNRGLAFNNFKLQDKRNNNLLINGRINMPTLTDFNLALNVKSKEFLFVDSEKSEDPKEDQMFFGKALAGINVDVTGTATSPTVTANVNVLEGTDLTYLLPESEVATIDKEGIVEFVDRSFYGDSLVSVAPNDTDTTQYATDMDIRAVIKINPLAKVNVEIDPSNRLEVSGGGDINFNLNPSGEMSLTGRYEITNGIYKLNFFNFAKKDFQIQKGSSITFYGDIMDMRADITAIHVVEAASYELMANQMGGASESELNKYKQKLPFEVVLNMNGEIMNPTIDFDIDIADAERGAMGGTINTRLQLLNKQESELNKQVFALLILGGFISENPLDRATGEMGFAEATARNTVSGLLTDQLNKLADKNLSGVDLSFDLNSYEDYSTGESQSRTQLGINLSKSFMDDRLTFQVGTNVDLEGEAAKQQQQQGLSSIAGDVIISYLITEDGRYKVQIFRENSYAGVIDGQIIQTGASLIFVREYDEFSELFKKDKEAERIKQEIKEQEKQRKEEEKRKKEEEEKRQEEEEKRQEEEEKVTTSLNLIQSKDEEY